MAKTVVDNPMVAHLWANQSQPSARSNNGNFYFEGRTIYSYGTHYPVAIITDHRDEDGRTVVLVNQRGYSPTTARHHGLVWQAMRGHSYRELMVPDLAQNWDRAAMLNYYADAVDREQRLAGRSRKTESVDWHNDRAAGLAMAAALYSNIYELNWPSLMENAAEVLHTARERDRENARQAVERRAAEAREQIARDRERAEAWLRGEPVRCPESLRHVAPLCRVVGDVVETTWGASVPLEAARRLVRTAAAVRAGAKLLTPPAGMRIGDFVLSTIEPDGTAVVGCHRLTFAEMARATCAGDPELARQLGFDCPVDPIAAALASLSAPQLVAA